MSITNKQEKNLIVMLYLKKYHRKLLLNYKLMMKDVLKLGNQFVGFLGIIFKQFMIDLELS
jgi:hypothetical protein